MDATALYASRVADEHALVGAALVDPVAASLLLEEVGRDGFRDPLARRVIEALHMRLDANEVQDLNLLIEDMAMTHDLDRLGGRGAVEALVADRPELRGQLAALRAAVGAEERDMWPAALVAHEHALVGAALVDPVAANLLLTEADHDAFRTPLARRVVRALRWVSEHQDDLHVVTTPDLELVIERMGLLGELDELGGREVVEELVADRPALREQLASLRAAAARIPSAEDEALVQFAAGELEAERT